MNISRALVVDPRPTPSIIVEIEQYVHYSTICSEAML